MSDFLKGLYADKPHEKARDFVKAKVSINIEKLGQDLKERWKAGEKYVNLQLLESKEGKYYFLIDDWKPEKQEEQPEPIKPEDDSDLPF